MRRHSGSYSEKWMELRDKDCAVLRSGVKA